MSRILWLLACAIPPWLAVKFGAPKWGLVLSSLPFFAVAMTLDDPDEHMFGEASEGIRKWLLALLALGGLALGAAAWSLRGTSSLLGVVAWIAPIALIAAVVGLVWILRK